MGNDKAIAEKKSKRPRTLRWLRRSPWMLFLPVGFLILFYFSFKMIISTPYVAELAEGYLTGYLQQRVDLEKITLSGVTLSVQGLAVHNPAGFRAGTLFSARGVAVAPDLPGFLKGRRGLSLLSVEGAKLHLAKNSAGEWNLAPLMEHLSRPRERKGRGIFIGRLILRDVSFQAGDFSLNRVSVTVNDLSTTGRADSRVLLTGADIKGNPFRLAASGRLGKDPDLLVTFDAPSFFIGNLLHRPRGFDAAKGIANLFLSIKYRSGEMSAQGSGGVSNIQRLVDGRRVPLHGRVDFSARYLRPRDEATVERLSLIMNDRAVVNGSGTLRRVKGEREYDVALSFADLKLRELTELLPAKTLRGMTVDGLISRGSLKLAGNRAVGITSGSGKLQFRNGEAAKEGRRLFGGLSSDMVISSSPRGWSVGGNVGMEKRVGEWPVDYLQARFKGEFSSRFRLLSVQIPRIIAAAGGVPVEGSLLFAPHGREPYRGRLKAANVPLTVFNSMLEGKGMGFSSGTADINLRGSGKGPESFSGEVTAIFSGVRGRHGGKDFSLKEGAATADLRRAAGSIAARGELRLAEASYGDKKLSAASSYSVSNGEFRLAAGQASLSGAEIGFDSVSGKIPVPEAFQGGKRYPLKVSFTGLRVEKGEYRIAGASGDGTGSYSPKSRSGLIAGNAAVRIPSLLFRGQPVASLNARAEASSEGSFLEISGTALDGRFSAIARPDRDAPAGKVSFSAALQDARAEKAVSLFTRPLPVAPSRGLLTVQLEGSWSRENGLLCGIRGSGADLALVSKDQTLVDGLKLALNADVAGNRLTVKEASLARGEAVSIRLSGSMTDVAKKERSGRFSISMETTPVPSLLGALNAALPPPLKQADSGGRIGLRGLLAVSGGKAILDGAAKCSAVRLDLPVQKVTVSGINGEVPFSLNFAGDVALPTDPLVFSKANYKQVLETLHARTKKEGGDLLQIERVSFGNLETEDIRLRVKAANGFTEISSLEASLFGGKLFGKGSAVFRKGLRYEADLLVSDVSLRKFCNSYPKLKGYISGLVDGVISLHGKGGGVDGTVGFVDLWTHAGKGEKKLVSKEFLQRLAGKKLKGFFFRDDRPYDRGEISAYLENGYLTFTVLDLSHTSLLGMKDLNVSVAPVQNRIGLQHLLDAIRQAAERGKPAAGEPPAQAPVQPPAELDLNWLE